MKFYQDWSGFYTQDLLNSKCSEIFKANVPGNIQNDFALANNYGDINFGNNFEKYKWMEDVYWHYSTNLKFDKSKQERVFFVSEGIDYQFDILLNNNKIFSHEGMFSKIELDLTESLQETNNIEINIYPVPKREGAIIDDRSEADQCCKPAVSYGWDWHPRVIPSGIWSDTYIETRKSDFISSCEPHYELSDDFNSADISFDIICDEVPTIELTSQDGTVLYNGTSTNFKLENITLWWCNGQGEPYLYKWRVYTKNDEKIGYIGFRHIELAMNGGAWDLPDKNPRTRSTPPITIKLNGREIFAKGSNWVNPEIFTGTITIDTYKPLVELAYNANMNIFRVWGGGIINKDSFYELCDKYGIMVWQEFPLACNNYVGTKKYLEILNQEATAIIKRLRKYASVILWCGGNELFNSWSLMTDQSLALRLLNKLCYELDQKTPFNMASPLMGMAHGGYVFYDDEINLDVFELFQSSSNTAYTEFGVPGTPDLEYLNQFIPQNELFPIEEGTSWQSHHALHAFGKERWLCRDILEMYFGKANSLEDIIYQSQWLQCEGYKAIFEEARRQKPNCSMAINWCYNEPWKTAANNSIVSYPAAPKPSYYAVKDALRPTLASARIPKFCWRSGEIFQAELWLLNDSPVNQNDIIKVYLEINNEKIFIMEWNTGTVNPNENKMGHKIQYLLPEVSVNSFFLILESEKGNGSKYKLLCKSSIAIEKTRQMNV